MSEVSFDYKDILALWRLRELCANNDKRKSKFDYTNNPKLEFIDFKETFRDQKVSKERRIDRMFVGDENKDILFAGDENRDIMLARDENKYKMLAGEKNLDKLFVGDENKVFFGGEEGDYSEITREVLGNGFFGEEEAMNNDPYIEEVDGYWIVVEEEDYEFPSSADHALGHLAQELFPNLICETGIPCAVLKSQNNYVSTETNDYSQAYEYLDLPLINTNSKSNKSHIEKELISQPKDTEIISKHIENHKYGKLVNLTTSNEIYLLAPDPDTVVPPIALVRTKFDYRDSNTGYTNTESNTCMERINVAANSLAERFLGGLFGGIRVST